MPLIEDYLELQKKYEEKYGDKTIVLYECGQFFEIYGVVNNEENLGKIYEIAEITNLSVSKRGGKKGPISRKNPLMAGFPNHSFEKWKNILLKHNYTIIKIEQSNHGEKDPERNITEIISPGINLDTTQFTNNLMSIYLEEIVCNMGKTILYAGISVIDITTGENSVYEVKGNPQDNRYSLDEIFRSIQTNNPSEIIINTENLITLTRDYIISYLEISNRPNHYDNFNNCKYLLENKYKNKFLDKLFPNHNMISTAEYLDLNTLYWGLSSYIYLLQFAYEHNETIINKLHKPKIWNTSNNLILSYDSINQLNVIPNKNIELNTKYDCLFNLLDNTSTCLGKRLLKSNLLNPILCKNELNKRYDLIEVMNIELNGVRIYTNIEEYLNKIFDIDRLHRKISLGIILPSNFTNLDLSYRYITKIIEYVQSIDNVKIKNILPNIEVINKFSCFINEYNRSLDMEKIHGCSQNNIKESIFKKGIYQDIDKLQEKINNCYALFNKLGEYFSDKISINNSIEIKSNERDGFYYFTTKKRAELLKKKCNKIGVIKLDINNTTLEIDLTSLEFKHSNSSTKIFSNDIRSYSEKLGFYESKMSKLCCIRFTELISKYDIQYKDTLDIISEFIGYIDFIKSNSKCAFKYGYCKPIINDKLNGKSYINSYDLRHPIIEKIHTSIEYIPNNVDIGENMFGMLLYGVNAVGKSSYMKSVGLSIIMAQAGLYVPASTFEFFPYKQLFTRISGNDNIFKGQSTFAVEMSELRSILKRSDQNSLVLGDELCSGTETISGLSIVSAGVITLEKKECSFIFATHLHQLSTMKRLKELEHIKNYHMETIYNNETGELIYNRKLKEGSGNAIYGLEVAKAMDLDNEFIQLANSIRKDILHVNDIVSKKKSQYNQKIIIDICGICNKKAEEVHHIKPQRDANKDNMIGNHHKNIKHNLITLCHLCHQQVENGDLEIMGYKQTSEGIKVDYKIIEKQILLEKKQRKKKYSPEQILIILEYKNKTNANITKTRNLLELDIGLKISYQIVKKIWNNDY
jgi:DNA mismatch repair protein MutS